MLDRSEGTQANDALAQSGTRKKGKRRPWRRAFLAALKQHGNIVVAANAVGVPRRSVYNHRARDPGFDQACLDAIEEFIDLAEAEVYRRAFEGEELYLLSRGKMVLDESGNPIKYRRRSDVLLMFWMKANRPKYRDNVDIDEQIEAAVKHAIDQLVSRTRSDGNAGCESEAGLRRHRAAGGAREFT
jgi:hypothetical protein